MWRVGVRRSSLCLIALSSSISAVAQTACPAGVPPGDPRCGPSPNWHPGQTQEQAVTQPPAPRVVERWEVHDDRYGAVAIDANGPYGMSFDHDSKEAASSAALTLCQRRGGRYCRVLGDFKNLCSTYAWGGGRAVVEGDRTPILSERSALERCKESSGVDCDVIETVCNKPVSRWVYEKPADW